VGSTTSQIVVGVIGTAGTIISAWLMRPAPKRLRDVPLVRNTGEQARPRSSAS
jgi:hypothetical protein